MEVRWDSFNRYIYAKNNPYTFVDPDGRESGAFYTQDRYRMAQPSPEHVGFFVDITPGIGDVKGFVDTYNDPSAINFAAATVGIVPGIGDAAGKALKAGSNIIEDVAKSATQIAQEGGRHAGQLQQFLKQSPDQLQRTIRSFDKQIAKHQGWVADPSLKISNFSQLRPEHQQNLLHHWQQDIARHQELKSIAQNVLKGL